MGALGGTIIVKLPSFSRTIGQENSKRCLSKVLNSEIDLAYGIGITTQLVSGNQDWSQQPGLLFYLLV